MTCRRILPPIALRHFIREYVVAQFLFADRSVLPPVRVYPANPEEALRFLINGELLSIDAQTSITTKLPAISVIGQPTGRQNLQISHDYLMLYVRFQPGSLFEMLHIPMPLFTDQHIDAALILGSEISELYHKLGLCSSHEDMISTLNGYFLKKISCLETDNHPVNKIGRMILQHPQGFDLQKTAKEACLSYRQFEKRFERLIGVTPKYYARICRFYQAFELKEHLPDLDWLSVAIRSNYHDYQHLVKDFKEFAGTTPSVLIQESLNSPSRMFSGSSNFRGV